MRGSSSTFPRFGLCSRGANAPQVARCEFLADPHSLTVLEHRHIMGNHTIHMATQRSHGGTSCTHSVGRTPYLSSVAARAAGLMVKCECRGASFSVTNFSTCTFEMKPSATPGRPLTALSPSLSSTWAARRNRTSSPRPRHAQPEPQPQLLVQFVLFLQSQPQPESHRKKAESRW